MRQLCVCVCVCVRLHFCQLQNRQLKRGADIIHLTTPPPPQHCQYRPAGIADVQPCPTLQATPLDREGTPVTSLLNEDGEDLVPTLLWAAHIAHADKACWNSVSDPIHLHQLLRRELHGRIRIRRLWIVRFPLWGVLLPLLPLFPPVFFSSPLSGALSIRADIEDRRS